MATAECRNDNCEKDQWELTKPIDEYADGIPNCPDCGSTKVLVRETGTGNGTAEAVAVEEADDAQAPARRDQVQEAERRPQPRGDTGAGEAIAQGAVALFDDSSTPAHQEEAVRSVGNVLVDAVGSLARYSAERDRARESRAKNVDVQEVEDKPHCPGCGATITNVPLDANRVECGECGKELQIVEEV